MTRHNRLCEQTSEPVVTVTPRSKERIEHFSTVAASEDIRPEERYELGHLASFFHDRVLGMMTRVALVGHPISQACNLQHQDLPLLRILTDRGTENF
jgi:hypothetical protein